MRYNRCKEDEMNQLLLAAQFVGLLGLRIRYWIIIIVVIVIILAVAFFATRRPV